MIRDSNPEDAAAIAAIWSEVIRDTALTFTSTEMAEAAVRAKMDSAPFLVAEAAGDIRGFATYAPFRAGPGYAHTMEHSIYLGPTARRSGIGRQLMAALEAQARADNVHSLIAAIAGENAAALAFHSGLGFAEVARIPEAGRKFDRWHDLVLMQKFL